MNKKFICKLLALGLLSTSLSTFEISKVSAAELPSAQINTVDSIQASPRTAYDWWVYNLGVSSWGISKIVGPYKNGSFNTEGVFGGNRTFTISWTGAPSNASFKIKSVGQDGGNSGSTNYSGYCSGSSGSITLTIPYADRGVINLYVDNYSSSTMNLTSVHVDSR